MPISSETKGQYLYVWFDTPFSEINIFDHPTAHALTEVMKAVDPDVHRAVLFLSRKPASFINGVGLLLASAIKTVDEAVKLTAPTRQAYLAVKTCPIPTVAVVKGNCFGCGVEFISHCTYRIAIASAETYFYMTELAEYLFVPAFGGTQLLPPLVGLEKASDFVLWGEKWDATSAKRFGLVSRVIPLKNWENELAISLPTLLAQYLKKHRPPSVHETFWDSIESRLSALPLQVQKVYRDTFHLLQIGAKSQDFNELTSRRELKTSAESVMRPESKKAQGFFFVRQSARILAERGRLESVPSTLTLLCPKTVELWARSFVSHTPESFQFHIETDIEKKGNGLSLQIRNHSPIPFLLGHAPIRSSEKNSQVVSAVYWPGYLSNKKLVELRNVESEEVRSELAFTFHKLGFSTILSQGGGDFYLNDFWKMTLSAMERLFQQGLSFDDVARSLRGFGFYDSPSSWAQAWGTSFSSDLSRAVAPHCEQARARIWAEKMANPLLPDAEIGSDQIPVKALIASWMSGLLKAISENRLAHLAYGDVVAREMVGFPLSHLCLSRYATKKWLKAEILSSTSVSELLPKDVLETLRRLVDLGGPRAMSRNSSPE